MLKLGNDFYDGWVLANGVQTHYSWAGTEGPAVIMLHGAGPGASGAAGWRYMLPALAEAGFRAFAPDQVSMGYTDTRPHAWPTKGHQSLVDHIKDFMDALCLDEAYIVGNSQGAYVAAKLAIDHPDRVKKVVLIGSNTIHNAMQPEPDPTRTKSFLEVIGYDYTEEAMRKFLTSNSYLKNAASVTEDLIQYRHQAAIREGYKESNEAFDAYLKKMNNDLKLWDRYCIKDSLPKLKVPTIFLWGKDDTLAPLERGYELEKMLPNIEFTFIDDCGHQCQTDQPELVNQMTIDFFNK